MTTSYYILPLDTKLILEKSIPKGNITQSIQSFIHLIATSHFGEYAYDETFGSEIWNVDFNYLKKKNTLKGDIEESLEESIERHEKRLDKIKVEVDIQLAELEGSGVNRIKKRVIIKINGVIKKNNEPFSITEQFCIAPLSY